MKAARSQTVELRGLPHHVLSWGDRDAPALFLVHGWMDVAASFQFLVDAFARERHVIAHDLRGFGGSAWQPQGYWFADYVADLDALVEHVAPGAVVDLAGHSLGGNVAMIYAGVRPQRVRRAISLDGFGIPAESVDAAPSRFAKWLDAQHDPPRFRPYAGLAAVADRLQNDNPRLTRERAAFLASHWAREFPDGHAELRSDPRHKLPFPTVYRLAEATAIWRAIAAPVLWVAGADSRIPRWLDREPDGAASADGLDGVRRRMASIRDARLVVIPDAGHMLHHDRPEAVAAAVEAFLDAP
ncbi:MAG TPA: alpha/beta fold hydrolase [Casimicrobiaceae bacterium]|nr:alpha/beta fold hydrolase [Casimicrobiaceae bacterium]